MAAFLPAPGTSSAGCVLDKLTGGSTVSLAGLLDQRVPGQPAAPHDLARRALNAFAFIGIRTYADLREIEVAQKPEGWDGKDLSKVKRVDLRGRNLAFADAGRAFLANADLRGADLTGAVLEDARLQGADLGDGCLTYVAQLQGANLSVPAPGRQPPRSLAPGCQPQRAELQGAELGDAQLEGVDLTGAQLRGRRPLDPQAPGRRPRQRPAPGRRPRLRAAPGRQPLRTPSSRAPTSIARSSRAPTSATPSSRALTSVAPSSMAPTCGAALWRALVPQRVRWYLADVRESTVRGNDEVRSADKVIEDLSANTIDEEPTRSESRGCWREPVRLGPSRARVPYGVAIEAGRDVQRRRSANRTRFLGGRPVGQKNKAYDETLAKFLAISPAATTFPKPRPAASPRAPWPLRAHCVGPNRLWPKLFAARVTGPDCSPAKALPDDMRRQLEQLAAQSHRQTLLKLPRPVRK